VKKILEREAKKQLDGAVYQGPVVSVIKEKELLDACDPSNLPYLHKNPAV
jgi:hypothetical protein